MKRRNFLKSTSAVGIPLIVGGVQVNALGRSQFNLINDDSDRVLVLIQLNGGNDGLNSVTPMDQYSKLFNYRPNVIIPEADLLTIDSDLGLHPSMTGMKSVYDDGKLNLLQSVGYPNQNRSHFRSQDIWSSASAADEFLTTGWIGRYLDHCFPNFPSGYPNAQNPDPFAMTIGSLTSETCQGLSTNFSMAVNDPFDLLEVRESVAAEGLDGCYGELLDFVHVSVKQTNAYSDRIELAADTGNNLSTKYGEDNRLAQQLKIVARLISGGLKTKIYVVNLGGFDTHAEQVEAGENATGAHSNLMRTLSDAICAFQDDLEQLGIDEQVLGMTFSEFGRRIKSNESFGTDHGTAAPLFVFGTCVKGGVIGENPEIPDDIDPNLGVPMQIDFRSIYGTVLMDWFSVPEATVKGLLYEDFQKLDFIAPCTSPTNTEELDSEIVKAKLYPNPANNWSQLEINVAAGWYRISLFDAIGSELKTISASNLTAGDHLLKIDLNGLSSGNYYVRIQSKHEFSMLHLSKI